MLYVLFELITNDNLQLRTKALEAIQYFTVKYKKTIIDAIFLQMLAKFMSVDSNDAPTNTLIQSLIVKSLSVIKGLDVILQEDTIDNGLLIPIIKLASIKCAPIQLKALDVLLNLDTDFRDTLKEQGFLKSLNAALLSNEKVLILEAFRAVLEYKNDKEAIRSCGLSLISHKDIKIQEEALTTIEILNLTIPELIEAGYLISLKNIMQLSQLEMQLKAIEILIELPQEFQSMLVKEKLPSTVLGLIANQTIDPLLQMKCYKFIRLLDSEWGREIPITTKYWNKGH